MDCVGSGGIYSPSGPYSIAPYISIIYCFTYGTLYHYIGIVKGMCSSVGTLVYIVVYIYGGGVKYTLATLSHVRPDA